MPLPRDERERILRLEAFFPLLRPISGSADEAARREALDGCRRLYQRKLVPDCRYDLAGPTVFVLSGGTNVGKSTLFNALLREEVSFVSPFARTTKSPALYLHRTLVDTWLANGSLQGYPRAELRSLRELADEHAGGPQVFYRSHEQEALRDILLADSPDLDSNYAANHRVAEDILLSADGVIFVTSPEKYNDQSCIEFLVRAAELGKRLWVVLNKAEGEEVLEDLAGRVLPGLLARPDTASAATEDEAAALRGGWRSVRYQAFDARPMSLRVLPAPYVRATERIPEAWADALRSSLESAGRDPEVRERSFRGALARFRRDFGRVLAAAREELAGVDAFRRDVLEVQTRCAADYRRHLEGVVFWELDEVYREVLASFRVPVVDDFYEAVGRAGQSVVRGFRALFGQESTPRAERLETERREADRAKALDALQACYVELGEAAESAHGALRPAALASVPVMPSPSRLTEVGQTHVHVVRDFTARWIREESARTLAKLKSSPYLTSIIRVVKGTLQLGTGVLSAYLTGGIHPHDLLVVPVAERGMKYLLDLVGGGLYYQNLRREFLDQREEMFAHLLHREAIGQVLEKIPVPMDPMRLAEMEKEVALLRGESE
ncbi:MAG: 50S ribosome-binding GTPase [Planctomycetes bacterium]|nr:50S ribosome-binding GTPase [Planctomycetota bacterium]